MARITEFEKLQLENAALYKMLRRLEGYAAGGGVPKTRALRQICEDAQTLLIEAKKQKKGLNTPDFLEEHCKFIEDACEGLSIEDPYIIIERVDARQYEAYIEDHDETLGVGVGFNAIQAVENLRKVVESFSLPSSLASDDSVSS